MAELAWSGVIERTAVCAPGEAFVEAADLHVRVVDAAQFILACHLQPGAAAPPSALQDAVAGVAGHPLPLAPNTRSGGDGEYAVWLDPGRWLAVGATAQRSARMGAWQAAVTGAAPEASVSDASDALVMLEVGGVRAWALMTMACSLDIEAALEAPRTARTGFAGATALLYRHGNGFRAHVDVTLLAHVREWLGQAARLLPRSGR